MKLYTLFISYRFGGQYCGVYPKFEHVYEVIKEMAEEMGVSGEVPEIEEIREKLEKADDYWHEFGDSTWIHVQEVSPQLVEVIRSHLKNEGVEDARRDMSVMR